MEPEPAPSSLTDRCKSTMEEVRASLAAEGALARAILRLLEMLLALLEDFKAGRLALPAPADASIEVVRAAQCPSPAPALPRKGEGRFITALKSWFGGAPSPQPDGAHEAESDGSEAHRQTYVQAATGAKGVVEMASGRRRPSSRRPAREPVARTRSAKRKRRAPQSAFAADRCIHAKERRDPGATPCRWRARDSPIQKLTSLSAPAGAEREGPTRSVGG
jgi:hypothetical protein